METTSSQQLIANVLIHGAIYADGCCNDETNGDGWGAVTDVGGNDLLAIMPSDTLRDITTKTVILPKKIKRLVAVVRSPVVQQQNNGAELVAMLLALRLAKLHLPIRYIYSDSQTIVDYWSNPRWTLDRKRIGDDHKVLQIMEVQKLRHEFEARGGSVIKIDGDYNPADFGFHKSKGKSKTSASLTPSAALESKASIRPIGVSLGLPVKSVDLSAQGPCLPPLVSLEGNIGAGKSTLFSLIMPRLANLGLNICPVPEPTDKWHAIKDSEGKDMLTRFYEDVPRYAAPFQMVAFITRMEELLQAQAKLQQQQSVVASLAAASPGIKPSVLLSERCVHSDMHIFAKNATLTGAMTEMHFNMYATIHASWTRILGMDGYRRHIVVYVNTSPETCLKRIAQRGRPGEDKITLGYLEQLDKRHQEWLGEQQHLVVIDGNRDYRSDGAYLDQQAKAIMTAIMG